jgi:phosphatidylglycerol:prolipoprotein diacylglycerol transferase
MTHNIEIFGIELTVKEVAFTIGNWSIYWYGIIIGIGCLLALIYGMKFAPRFNLNRDKMLDVVIVTIPVAVLCARLYYCIFDNETGDRIDSLREFFGIGTGAGFSGLAIYGGIIGAFLCGALMCKIKKVKMLDMFDLAAVGFLIGQAIGRWGNFINQEAYGTVTGSNWWGMQSEVTRMDPDIYALGGGLVHPCFLYESLWCLIGFILLNHLSKKRKFSGQIFLMYGVWYGFGRFFIESIRTDQLTWGGSRIPISMVVSGFAFAVCLIMLFVLNKKTKLEAEAVPYESLFNVDDEKDEITEETADETVETEYEVLEETDNGTDN